MGRAYAWPMSHQSEGSGGFVVTSIKPLFATNISSIDSNEEDAIFVVEPELGALGKIDVRTGGRASAVRLVNDPDSKFGLTNHAIAKAVAFVPPEAYASQTGPMHVTCRLPQATWDSTRYCHVVGMLPEMQRQFGG